jgi:hypothetical protein
VAWTVLDLSLEGGRAPLREYGWTDRPLVALWKRKGPFHIQALELSPRTSRLWTWPILTDEAQRVSLQAFFQQLAWTRVPFLVRDPRDGARRVTLEPGVGNGAIVTFSLPTPESSEDFRFYPANLGTTLALLGGATPTAVTVNTDARTVTFAAAPGAVSVELVYTPLRLARLVAPAEWASMSQVFSRPTLQIEEILRD